MLKKILSMCLLSAVLTLASGSQVLAQKTNALTDNQSMFKEETVGNLGKKDLKSAIAAQNSNDSLVFSKSTLSGYERAKRQGNGLSTNTKVLIGVGITAAVVVIMVFAASRDKIRTF